MADETSLWPLFSEDYEFATSYLNTQLREHSIFYRKGIFAHYLITLGQLESVQSRLNALHNNSQSQEQSHIINNLRFRIARANNECNPHQYLLADADKLSIQRLIETSKSLDISLHGGIGDYVEDLCFLIPWSKAQRIRLNLVMHHEMVPIFKTLFSNHHHIHYSNQTVGLKSFCLRWWIQKHAPNMLLQDWAATTNNPIKRRNLLCCWRAEGYKDRFSIFNRSVKFQDVWTFYKKIKTSNRIDSIVDITNWDPKEIIRLENLGITCKNPKHGNLADLIKMMNNHVAISIDTSLIHLCAASGRKGILIASANQDERWQELLHKKGCYQKNIKPMQSKEFCSFQALMKNLPTFLNDSIDR